MPKDALQDTIDEFVAKVRSVTRQEAIDAMHAPFGGDAAPPRVSSLASARGAARRTKSGKRDPEVLEALVSRLAAEIKSKPGKRVEEIGKSLGISTGELALPVKKLLAAKKIEKTGNRRATKYFPVRPGKL